MKNFIAYYRVSTIRQGQSGLGLESQKESVTSYLKLEKGQILQEFVEVESGRKNNRPELQEAIRACKKHKATLIIAKLDRLARNVHFISGLMEGGIEFVAVDNPHANRLMLHMLAAFAEHEREQISLRTKAALAAAKARGVKLGVNGKSLALNNKSKSIEFALSVKSVIKEIQNNGKTFLREIAAELNAKGIPSYRGGCWYPTSVARVLKHY